MKQICHSKNQKYKYHFTTFYSRHIKERFSTQRGSEKLWNQKKTEGEKLVKQCSKDKEHLAFWISKTKMLEEQLKLKRMMCGKTIPDCRKKCRLNGIQNHDIFMCNSNI